MFTSPLCPFMRPLLASTSGSRGKCLHNRIELLRCRRLRPSAKTGHISTATLSLSKYRCVHGETVMSVRSATISFALVGLSLATLGFNAYAQGKIEVTPQIPHSDFVHAVTLRSPVCFTPRFMGPIMPGDFRLRSSYPGSR